MQTTHSSCPVVRKGTMRLFESATVDGKSRYFPIEKDILWLRQSEAAIKFMHGGACIREHSTMTDFYGFLTSIEGALEDIKKMAPRIKLDAASTLSMEIEMILQEVPVREDLSKDGVDHNSRYRRRQYLSVPNYHNGNKYWYLEDCTGRVDGPFPRLEPVEIEKRVVYSTLGRPDPGDMPAELAAWIAEERRKTTTVIPAP
jgi:hypothetical protein